MSTAISTHKHDHLPLLATLSVVGIIAATGAVGVVWHESATSDTQDPAPALTPPKGSDYRQYEHYYAGQKVARGHVPTTSGGRTVDGP
jgi:hypothetical protein